MRKVRPVMQAFGVVAAVVLAVVVFAGDLGGSDPVARSAQGLQLPRDRPDPAERALHRLRRARARAVDDLRGDRLRRPVEVGQQRPDLGVDLRQPAGHLDRRHRRRRVEPQHRLRRHRRGQHVAQHLLGRRRLQVHRRRQDVDERRPEGHPAHRPDGHRPEEPRHRLRRGAGPPLLARTTSAACSRRSTAARPGRSRSTSRRTARRSALRHRDGSGEARDPLRGHLRQGTQAVDVQPRRPGQRHLQDD